MPASPGRPRLASQELLQEAAFELFQLRGYRATSVDRIAKTAGFSRATFFNFFPSKAELFWVETDALIAGLRAALERGLESPRPAPLRAALLAHAASLGSASIPWALQHYRLMEAENDLVASGASRVLGITRMFADYLARRGAEGAAAGGTEGEGAGDRAAARAAAAESATLVALLLVAMREWIDAGADRGSLRDHLELAL
ncbi:MAG: TetR family transcriptional regulator [Leucobacter sp.]|nr:TetR family transcriptional regulator [Leucobacter sp.]